MSSLLSTSDWLRMIQTEQNSLEKSLANSIGPLLPTNQAQSCSIQYLNYLKISIQKEILQWQTTGFCLRDCPFFQTTSVLSRTVLIMHLQSLEFNLKHAAAFTFRGEKSSKSHLLQKSVYRNTSMCASLSQSLLMNHSLLAKLLQKIYSGDTAECCTFLWRS